MTTSMDAAQLGNFSPFDTLESAALADLLENVDIRHAPPGQLLFQKGDTEKRSIYVLSGTLALRNGDQNLGTIEGGTDEARNPVAPKLPRRLSAVAVDDVEYFSIDSELVDLTLTLDHTGVYEVGDVKSELTGGERDWMSALLGSNTFQNLPPQNIQMIFMRLQRVDYQAGHIVFRQGSKGDHFYIIRTGRCKVARETPGDRDNIFLAELGVGDTFGEEALLSDEARNATIIMDTDGSLMRLSREDFQLLLNDPMVVSLEHDDADEAITQGSKWLDVRVPSEFKAFSKVNAVNLPLYMLRFKLDALDRKTPYVVYCDTGRRSSAAAFILSQQGFETAVLKGGLN
ncbi:MAG: cyclic nucleotide-binding domain-containing protein, partial [Gammaproteobacteria bacterium]|nr:cyclic nucleotide-binding domain-containing protein [Gammaproteobacteria bacterium]